MAEISKISKISRELGNTKPTPSKAKSVRARRWCLTWHNYTPETLATFEEYCKINCVYYVLGKELTKKGIKHIQGYIEFKNQKTLTSLVKTHPQISKWIVAKGNKSQNLTYCSKEGDFSKKLDFKEKLKAKLLAKYDNVKWKKWQSDILNFIETVPDDRTIYWVHEELGNIGKSYLAKYIVMKYACIIANGKKDNIFNQIKLSLDEEKEPKIIILDIPRYNLEYINYGCLEQLKNGMLYSGKYEGGICLFDNPHIIVFANEEPNTERMSKDRWKIINLNKTYENNHQLSENRLLDYLTEHPKCKTMLNDQY